MKTQEEEEEKDEEEESNKRRRGQLEQEMTEVQMALWPDQMPSDPVKVAALYDANAETYGADTIADGWAATFQAMQPKFQMFLDAWRSRCPSRPLRVLDAGCGDGLLAEYIELPKGTELRGCDLSAKLVAIAEKKGIYASLIVADLGVELPYAADMFDFIFCNGVLGYIEGSKPITSLIRVLAPGGQVCVCFRHEQWQRRRYEEALGASRLLSKELFDPYPQNDGYTHTYVCACICKEEAEAQEPSEHRPQRSLA